MLAIAHPSVLPSASLNDVGTPVAIISQLNTLPACAPVNASMAALRLATHDSGSGWFATPFLYDSFIHNSTPVYPGALSSLLEQSFSRTTFSHQRLVEIILGPIMGGVGTHFGPIIGAALLTVLAEGATEFVAAVGWDVPGVKQLVYGIVLPQLSLFCQKAYGLLSHAS